MSIALDHHPQTRSKPVRSARAVSWSSPTPGLWVLNNSRSFGGTIDRRGPRFTVTGSRGEQLGRYPTLTAAQQALLTHTRSTPQIGTAA